jgi:serine/threonine protein kinase
MLLGTAAYMSPEQVKGQPADRRSDVWAFGCLLFEMLTGRAAFQGDSHGEILGGVLKSEPDWQLVADAPEAIQRVLRRCLQKDSRNRLRGSRSTNYAARVSGGECLVPVSWLRSRWSSTGLKNCSVLARRAERRPRNRGRGLERASGDS